MGIGIWSMHFVGMLALEVGMTVGYDVPLVALSLLVAVMASAIAFLVASRPHVSARALGLASLIMGSAIAGMHYIGMTAMHMPAHLRYDIGLVALSVAVAIAAAFGSLLLANRLRHAELRREPWLKLASALLMSAAIYGMHYIGMAAAGFVPAPAAAHSRVWEVLGTDALAGMVAIATLVILGLVLLGTLADRWFRTQLAHAEAMRESQERLRASEAELRALVEGMRDVVIVFDVEGRYVRIPHTAPELIDRPSPDLIGKRMHDVISPEAASLLLTAIRRALATRDAVRMEYTLPIGDRDMWFSAVLSPISADHVVCVARDITESRKQQEALVAALHEAEAANRAKSDFLAHMSHELRTPLNSIIGFANVLHKNRHDTLLSRELQYVARIRDNGRNLLVILDDILDIAKLEAGRVEIHTGPVDVAALLREAIALLGGHADGGTVCFALEAPTTAAALVTDEARLRQVVVNLMGNAMKFTHAGTVTLRLLLCPVTGAPLAIEVADTGIGIPPARLEAIFESFEQADNSTARQHGGTGLGLAISRKLCERLGFTLTATSEPGVGSTFRIGLHAADEPTTLPAV
jgi:PAS domain S-box-containing protein